MRLRDVVQRAGGASKRFAQQNLAAGGIHFRRGYQNTGVPGGTASRWGSHIANEGYKFLDLADIS